MTDIVISLRQWTDRDGETTPLGKAAADEIERLRAALKYMRYFDIGQKGLDIINEALDADEQISVKEGK